ncbi:hypothetical protein [Mesorhizobium sp. 8]|jgi:hypothetical protein|uniref:hypothetical protein n=1 Tax=Mesorhizobium sp. 8 TaxID=2584466 RepID=UPI0011245498|nr:hypothetical protein [Mesorhizobium sp. 8]QDC00943.1 hypothetical protein FGU64_11220 [Mesorhizobium sp. 8]
MVTFKLLAAVPLFLAAGSAYAVPGLYVYCDNGLRCVKAPCRSNNALDLKTGAIIKGVSIDTKRLPEKDRAADLLYAGKLVLRGSIERRTVTYTGKAHELPYLVVTAIERKATMGESARCKAR